MLQSYLPVIVFASLGLIVGGAFTVLNKVLAEVMIFIGLLLAALGGALNWR